jgi:hypothetical protein
MRISLAGQGDPIPEVALPAPGEDPDFFSLSFQLEDGVDFVKAPYVEQGYTHFEVWCVGAVGGRGGDLIDVDAFGGRNFWGGGGGGGGLHRVAGLLADLPDNCPVVVGQAGADGDPIDELQPYELITVDGAGHVVFPISTYPNPDYVDLPTGGDGGASSFNGTTCHASGGKGGAAPTPDIFRDFLTAQHDFEPPGTTFTPTAEYAREIGDDANAGSGGEGGCGNRSAAGGGAAGGVGHLFGEAANGTWDGSIGKGGGGGRGGFLFVLPTGDGIHYTTIFHVAGNGGKGSFSFANISVFGDGQRAFVESESSGKATVPGAGGGAKANKLLKYGSRAPGFNPNGVVFIRLYKLT